MIKVSPSSKYCINVPTTGSKLCNRTKQCSTMFQNVCRYMYVSCIIDNCFCLFFFPKISAVIDLVTITVTKTMLNTYDESGSIKRVLIKCTTTYFTTLYNKPYQGRNRHSRTKRKKNKN